MLRVSFEKLIELLALPDGTEILSIEGGSQDLVGICGIVVEHHGLGIVQEGERAPIMRPQWSWDWDNAMTFDGWNQE